jgi:hypothetical protein
MGASWLFALFGLDASRASIKDGVFMVEFWNTSNMLVGVIQVVIAGVTEAMVPKQA